MTPTPVRTDDTRSAPPPKPVPPKGLIVLNAVLLGVLGLVSLAPDAGAQAGSGRQPGSYAMVGGELPFGNSNGVYILDSANRQLVAVTLDDAQQDPRIEVLGYRDLGLDVNAGGGR